ncbi:MAG: type II secretion system protein [Patescibacteria group bacterium]
MKETFKKTRRLNQGMTYIEIIVVLSIFSILTAISMYNYGAFQGKVDVKNLANDIALKLVQAQKDATGGKIPARIIAQNWKPAYGVVFNRDTAGLGDTAFLYFTDLDSNKSFDYNSFNGTDCTGVGECLEKINITKGNTITKIESLGTGSCGEVRAMSATWSRPNLTPTLFTVPALACVISAVKISVQSPKGNIGYITIYNSGRVQID